MGKLQFRSHIESIKPYEPGKPIELVQRELGTNKSFIKLASNENPLGPSPRALAAIAAMLGRGHLYPDDACYFLRERLAADFRIPLESIRIGNGSSELIYLLGIALLGPGDNVVVSQYSFNMPRIVAEVLGSRAKIVPLKAFRHDVDALLAAVDDRTKVMYLDLPMNPIGTTLSRAEFDELVSRTPEHVLLVCDEAYREFAAEDERAESERFIRLGRNVLMLRTFSKLYGLAGFRVGYGIGSPELMEALRKVSLAFAVNSAAQAGALAALDDIAFVRRTLELTEAGKHQIQVGLAELKLPSLASSTNFLAVNVGCDSKALCTLLEQHGVIVRPLSGYGLPTYIRVTVGTQEQNRKFLKSLASACAALRS